MANNELVLHYQPRVDVKTGTVVAVEVLLRWKHPVKGLIGPNEFIHVAEGVETPAQLAFIGNAGCDEYQGYLFSRALSELELVALLQGKDLLRDNHLHGSASTS